MFFVVTWIVLSATCAFAASSVDTHHDFRAVIGGVLGDKHIVFNQPSISFGDGYDSGIQPSSGAINMVFEAADQSATLSGGFATGSEPQFSPANGDDNRRFLTRNTTSITGNDWTLTFNSNLVISDFGSRGQDNYGDQNFPGGGGAIYHRSEGYTTDTVIIGGTGNVVFRNNRGNGGDATAGNTFRSNGSGGAISAPNLEMRGSGDYLFSNNQSIGGKAVNINSKLFNAGHGGAISAGNIEIGGSGNYAFINNVAGTGGAESSGDQDGNAHGGAINIYTTGTFTTSGTLRFEGNQAYSGGATGAGSVVTESGHGGAVFGDRSARISFETNSLVEFVGNSAIGSDASDGGHSRGNGKGGAISMWMNPFLKGSGDYVFDGNYAQGGDATTAGVTSGSGLGGAVSASINKSGTGDLVFTNNKAIGGGASGAGSDSSQSGRGGAVCGGGTWDGAGRVLFDNNTATGGLARNGGDASGSGLGGAILVSQSLSGVGGTFTNNHATTLNTGDVTSGLGGAIFAGAGITLTAKENAQVIFQGNTHNPGGQGAKANSIYFGYANGWNRLGSV